MTDGLEPRSVLFLSCDLVGSTAHKQGGGRWVHDFLSFYRQFPQVVEESLLDYVEENPRPNRIGSAKPFGFELWKPIGDELIFTVDVVDEFQVYDAVNVWIKALDRYQETVKKQTPMGTKGGAFLATFPAPDEIVSIPKNPKIEDSYRHPEVLNRDAIVNRNDDEYLYDYCGPSIDTGFRIIGACDSRFFTLSLEVTWAYMAAYEEYEARKHPSMSFLGGKALKGVWKGREYPLFAVDRLADDPVNRAVRDLNPDGLIDATKVTRLAKACHATKEWRGAIFLPGSDVAEFRRDTPEPPLLPADNAMEGSETPTEEKRDSTKDSALDLPIV